MVDVQPFCGLRYAPSLAGPDVLAPPYDVIDEPLHRALLARSPFNVVRLILGEPSGSADWHDAAGCLLRHWQAEGILARDRRPSFYGYRQTFHAPDGSLLTRSGLVARVRLAPWGEGIHRHEHTRSAPREDRLRLMRATGANLSPVFGLYRDPDGALRRWLRPPKGPALEGALDGVREMFWPISDAAALREVPRAFAGREIVIADGHHRYETALAYRDERNAGLPADEEAARPDLPGRPWDYVLMLLVAAEDPGLLVLPTHRVIMGGEPVPPQQLLRSLTTQFIVEPVERGTLREAAAAAAGVGTAMGLCMNGSGRWLLRLRDPAAPLRLAPVHRAEIAALDVSVLQNLVLSPLLGITPQALDSGDAVRYTISEEEACSEVVTGRARAAFVLNPTTVEQVWSAALAGATMPQKSTYFHPKPLTGLVINPLSDPETARAR